MTGDSRPSASGMPGSANSSSYPLDRYSVVAQNGSSDSDQSPYFQSSAPSISLPKGGGSLKSIDEKFSVNAVNGTSSLQVALPLSPGRGNFTPALSVSYNSGSGNGAFGLGWSLSLPAIQRRTDKRLPRYDDTHDSDIFLLAGAEDLVPELDASGAEPVTPGTGSLRVRRYRPRIEGLFARIEWIHDTTTSGSWWRVTTRDNITTYYGLTAEARISDPKEPTRIFTWLPELVCDHKGNVQRYRYLAEDLRGVTGLHEQNRLSGLAPVANRYLKQVDYCNTTPWFCDQSNSYAPEFPEESFRMTAVLDYGDHQSYKQN